MPSEPELSAPDLFANVPRSAFEKPGTSRGLLDVIRWRYLLRLLVHTGVTTRYRNSVLGWTWSYVRPAMQFLVFWLVMGVFMNLGDQLPNYPVYLFSGIIGINFFSEAFGNATRSIVGNAPLVRKVYLPRQLFSVSAVFVAFVHFLPQVGLLLIVCLFMGWIVHITIWSVLAFLAGIVILAMVSFGAGLFFGAVNVRFRDAEPIVELLLMLVTWASPVLYFWTMVRDAFAAVPWLVQLYMLNPITVAVELFHTAFWEPVSRVAIEEQALELHPDLGWLTLWAFLISLATILIGQFVFRRLEGRFAQDL
ncbi:ABC transporter permease [Microbacterium rhizophilus]|uniref:ABC transporter permease n=1 Tax=Microbacterium rhizophilus TaxID=3138934 RepID=UPI0031E8CC7D